MTFFATKFSGQPFQVTDARQTMNFIERQKDMERERKEKAKALSEDQKKLGMIAQGMGLEKGEIDSMSRGELQGFIQSGIQQSKTVKDAQEHELNLRKFMLNQQAQKANIDYNAMIGEAQLTNAETNSMNALNRYRHDESVRLREQAEREAKAQGAQNLMNNIQQYANVLTNPKAFTNAQVARVNDFATKYPDVLNQAFAGASSLDVYNTFLNAKAKDPADRKLTPEETVALEGDKTLAKEAMKDYQEWQDTGGPTEARDKINTITKVLNDMESGKVETGRLINWLGENVTKFLDETSVDARQKILAIAQEELKKTLGGQFTQKEAEMFFDRAWDPKIDTQFNIARVQRVLRKIVNKENYRTQYYDYINQNPGNPRGFKFDPSKLAFDPGMGGSQTSNGTGFRISNIPGSNIQVK